MSVRGVLFDKDGTLTDFQATWIPAYWAAAKALGDISGDWDLAARLMSIGGYRRDTGRCAPDSVLACGSTEEIATQWTEHSRIEVSVIMDVLSRAFSERAADNAVPATDLAAVFSSLHSRGLVLGIATMDSEALAHQLLSNFNLNHFFEFVCGYDSGFGVKPGPGMVHGFCAHCAIQVDEVAVVGDTPHDMHMGRNAGVAKCIGVLSGASELETLEGLADNVVGDIGEIDTILL